MSLWRPLKLTLRMRVMYCRLTFLVWRLQIYCWKQRRKQAKIERALTHLRRIAGRP